MEMFLRSIGMPTSIHEMGIVLADDQIDELVLKCSNDNTRTIGAFKVLSSEDMKKIYEMAR